ncbi:hypothetical protein EDD18DRAFT_1173499, partial [Armillaria luteobubalina]
MTCRVGTDKGLAAAFHLLPVIVFLTMTRVWSRDDTKRLSPLLQLDYGRLLHTPKITGESGVGIQEYGHRGGLRNGRRRGQRLSCL